MQQSTETLREAIIRVSVLLATISVLAAVIGIHDGTLSAEQPAGAIVLPFVWRDVAVVCLLSPAPLAWMLGQLLSERFPGLWCGLLAALLWTIAWNQVFWLQETAGPLNKLPALPGGSRFITSFCITVGTALIVHSRILPAGKYRRNDLQTNLLRALCCLTVLTLVPRIYLDARGRYDAEQYFSLRQQSRLGEARSLLKRMLILDPAIQQDGQLLRRDQYELDRTIDSLNRETRTEFSATFSFDQQLQRARQLAMLGRTNEAVKMLLEAPEATYSAEACSLLGTMHENRRDWNSAIRFYGMAENLLRSPPADTSDSAEAYQVAMGSAYCYRRLGRLTEARARYSSLLEINPNADTHFLVAQFFEDIQETSSARHHALEAIQLDPNRYRERGHKLIRKMQTLHFRCLSVYRNSSGTDE
jgi:tetratricopeptide (TPR) repeat protein